MARMHTRCGSDWPAEANQHSGQWTPDGRHFVFSSDREGRSILYELASAALVCILEETGGRTHNRQPVPILAAAPMHDSQGLFVLGKNG